MERPASRGGSFFVIAVLLSVLSLQQGECCSRGLQGKTIRSLFLATFWQPSPLSADSVLPSTRTTRYEMVGAFSRPLTPDEQIGLRDEVAAPSLG